MDLEQLARDVTDITTSLEVAVAAGDLGAIQTGVAQLGQVGKALDAVKQRKYLDLEDEYAANPSVWLSRDEKDGNSILVSLGDEGAVFFATMVDERWESDDPDLKRWWIYVQWTPEDYPAFFLCLKLASDNDMRRLISAYKWCEILKDRTSLFDGKGDEGTEEGEEEEGRDQEDEDEGLAP
jgi:hypothetical protein